MKPRTLTDELEDKIYDAQEAYILEKFGKQAAVDANYGWGADYDSISTKVYGHGVLTSYIEDSIDSVVHDFNS